jgi:lipoprotein-anchoring transpeptidase ErfK/SrfK
MIRSFAIPIALVAIGAPATPAAGQSGQSGAADAAEAAQQVADRAAGSIEKVDPDQAAATYAGLPPLVEVAPAPEAAIIADAPEVEVEVEPEVEVAAEAHAAPLPSREPAVRMIAGEVVQPLPVAALATPAPVAAPVPAAIVSKDPFVIKSILPIEGTIRYGDWFWDESAAPATGKLIITVDLDARVISAFRDGHEIGTAVALLGTQKHPTPLGTFPILTKEKDNVSEKYDNAPMPWTLRLTWSGIAIHGSPVMNGYASHGCIGVPDEFAAKLFAAAKRGDKVIITRGKMIGLGDKVM